MRKVQISFPNGAKIAATIVEDHEIELADLFWDIAGKGETYIVNQPISCGYGYKCYPKPSMEYPIVKPKYNHAPCDMEQCAIYFDGAWLRVNYAPQTETLVMAIGLVARIDPECIEAYKAACLDVTYRRITYNEITTCIELSRLEE